MSPGFRHDKGMAQRWMGPLPDCLGSVGQERKRRRREEGVGEGFFRVSDWQEEPRESWGGFLKSDGVEFSAH